MLDLKKNYPDSFSLLEAESVNLNCDEDFNCIGFLNRALKRDEFSNNACRPSSENIINNLPTLLGTQELEIKGNNRYLGHYPRMYRYYLSRIGQTIQIRVPVFIKNPKNDEVQNYEKKLEAASETWNRQTASIASPLYDLKFKFEVTTNKSEASGKIRLTAQGSHGPYDTVHSLKWGKDILAHEFGHFLGLDDEYKNDLFNPSTDTCSFLSIMCNSEDGSVLPRHLYMILRRPFCVSR